MQGASLDVPYLDEARLECEHVRMVIRKRGWVSFPVDDPVALGTPTILVDVKGKLVVTQQELARDTVDRDGLDVLAAVDKVERCVCWIQQALRIERLEIDNLETLCTSNAELGFEEMDRTRLGRNVELLEHTQRILSSLQQLLERRLLLASHVLLNGLERLDRRR